MCKRQKSQNATDRARSRSPTRIGEFIWRSKVLTILYDETADFEEASDEEGELFDPALLGPAPATCPENEKREFENHEVWEGEGEENNETPMAMDTESQGEIKQDPSRIRN